MPRPLLPALALFLSLPISALAAEHDWPQWRGPNRDNRWPVANFPAQLPARMPSLWAKPVGRGYGGIAVVGRAVFVMDRQTTPKEVERVLCLDLDTGETKWVREYPVSYKGIDYA